MVNRASIVMILLLLLPLQSWANLTASVDRNPILAGEFFNLTIRAEKNVKGQQPDTAPLLKDFVVGPTSVRSSTNIINGQVNHSTMWQIELMARNPGNYTIPGFKVANMQSQPLNIKVVTAGNAKEKDISVYIETSMESAELYVQQAGVYTIKLFLANDLTEGQLGSPELDDANVSQLGKQKENYEIIDGIRYLVIERNYLIQPQKSGQYTIKSPYFKGRIRDNYRTRAASAIGQDIQLDIKPIPTSVSGNWLPSELVTLNEEWQPEKQEYQVGEPITRTITLTALGITKEQLPEITLPRINGVRSYSDQADNNTIVRNGKVISQKVESFALMPQTPGTYTLPEVRIPWFNIITNRTEYATLPSHTLTVIGDPNFSPTQSTSVSVPTPLVTEAEPKQLVTNPAPALHYWLITALGYLLWLITLVIAWRLKKSRPVSVSNQVKPITQNNELLTLREAANQNNQRAFYHGLLKLCQQYTQSTDLNKLAKLIDSSEFEKQIQILQANLYGAEKQSVELKSIIGYVEKYKNKPNTNNELGSLY